MNDGAVAAPTGRAAARSGDSSCSAPGCISPSFAWLPVCSCVITVLTFAITYSVAVMGGHVEALLPYISDTGTRPPESCVFTLGLSLLAIAISGIMYVRYKAVEAFPTADQITLKLSKWSLCLGLTANLGLLLVASFQETNVGTVHIIGAVLAFGAGAVYCLIQTVVTHRQRSGYSRSYIIFWVRAVSSAVAGAAAVTSIAARFVAISIANYSHSDRQWQPSDAGYAEHLTSTFAEWIAGAALQAFILTFTTEFSRLGHGFWKFSEPSGRPEPGSVDASADPFLSATDNAQVSPEDVSRR